MKYPLTIGIVGGMSPESTAAYYQYIVRRHQAEFHDHSYPRIIISSVSFQQYIEWQHAGGWDKIADELTREFHHVAAAGADFAILATNTMHKVLPQIESPIPVLNILNAITDYAKAKAIKAVGLTGTKFTMSDGFYAEGLGSRGLTVVLPDSSEQERIHNIIYSELILGNIYSTSADDFNVIARRLLERGAEAILLACTELALLTPESYTPTKFIDSTQIHANVAWETAIGRLPL